MNQIKYVLDACLILMMALMGIFLYATFPESGIIGKTENKEISLTNNTEASVSKGQMIFKQKCASCHHMVKEIVAPPLQGVADREPWTDREKLKSWIKDPGLFFANDPYVKQLFDKYKVRMPDQNLSDAEAEEVIRYIASQ